MDGEQCFHQGLGGTHRLREPGDLEYIHTLASTIMDPE